MEAKRSIICLETEWEFNKCKFEDEFCSEHLLKFLKGWYKKFDYIYRRVATKAELGYYLSEFGKKAFDKYEIFYLSFHGSKNAIVLEGEKESISLEELANMAKDKKTFFKRIVHFSCCRTFIGSKFPIEQFKSKTEALIVSGYRKSVDPMQSAILDIAYFNELMNRKNLGLVENAMKRLHGNLESNLGFEIYK